MIVGYFSYSYVGFFVFFFDFVGVIRVVSKFSLFFRVRKRLVLVLELGLYLCFMFYLFCYLE